METNEQGLTKEEKIMFGILGIILIIAIGVLIINSFSSNERKLDDSETPINETKGQKEDKVEDETTTHNQKENLIEDKPVDKVVTNTVVSKKPSPKPIQTVVKPSKPIVEEENLGTGDTDIPGIIEWSFKETMVTEASSNTSITIDREVVLNDGTIVEAVVTVRKLEGNSWNIIDISSNEIIVTEGLYKYYYTYGNQTKELLLTVKNELQPEKIEFLKLSEVYEETYPVTNEEFTIYQNTLLNSTLTTIDNTYTLETIKSENNSNMIPIVLTMTEELTEPTLTSSTLGVTPSIENNNWYQPLTTKDIILWIDLSVLDLTNPEINLNINGTDYYFNLNIVVNDPSAELPDEDDNPPAEENPPTDTNPEENTPDEENTPEEDNPSEEDSTPEEDDKINNEDNQEQEKFPEEEPPKEDPPEEIEDNVIENETEDALVIDENNSLEDSGTLNDISPELTNSELTKTE